jgi:hypothetical protein
MSLVDSLNRDELIGLLIAVDGVADLTLDDVILTAVVLNSIGRITDAAKLARALDRPLTYELRAALVARGLELQQPSRAMPTPTTTESFPLAVFVPPRFDSLSHFIDAKGRARAVYLDESGRRVLDMTPAEYKLTFLGGALGDVVIAWSRIESLLAEFLSFFLKADPGYMYVLNQDVASSTQLKWIRTLVEARVTNENTKEGLSKLFARIDAVRENGTPTFTACGGRQTT